MGMLDASWLRVTATLVDTSQDTEFAYPVMDTLLALNTFTQSPQCTETDTALNGLGMATEVGMVLTILVVGNAKRLG
jgi:hypothetical protein